MRLHSSLLRRWSLTLIAITGVTCALSAQTDDDRMQVDRPDQSQGTSVLTPRRLQVEWGVGGDSGAHNMELMLRYGLIPDLELRLGGQLRERTPRARRELREAARGGADWAALG